ncbi:MAG: TolC family protein [Bacteroidaceae bacterium]|nr:TolC family protein [Bacteroidaceae bacterium]
MKRFLLLLVLAVLATSAALRAQRVTLDECRAAARRNYPTAARHDLIRQTSEMTQANIAKGWLPQVSATAQGTAQSAVATLPDGLSTMLASQGYSARGISRFQYRAGLDVQQTVYDGGRIRAASDVERGAAVLEGASLDADLYAVEERAEQLFFGALLLDERLRIGTERIALAADNLRKLRAMLQGGTAAQCDVAAMEAELIAARQDSLSLACDRDRVLRTLALLCGFDEMPQTLVRPTLSDIGQAGTRPELRVIDARLSLLDARRRQYDSALRPTLSLFGQGWYGYTGFDMFHDMMHRTPTLNGLAGVRLSWNITPLYTRRQDLATLRLQRQEAETARETFLLNQRIAATEQQASLAKWQRLIAQDADIVRLRTEVRTAAEARLAGGTVDVNGLVQELTRERLAKDTRALHEIQLLQEACALRHTAWDE